MPVDVEGTGVDEVPDEPIFVGYVPDTGQGEGLLGGAAGVHLLEGVAAPHTVHCSLVGESVTCQWGDVEMK